MGTPDVRDSHAPGTDRAESEAWRAVLSLHGDDDDLSDDDLSHDDLGSDVLGGRGDGGVRGGWIEAADDAGSGAGDHHGPGKRL